MVDLRLSPVFLLLLLLLGTSAAEQPAPPPPALALSGSGFLGLFFTGAIAQLQELGLANRATPVTGTSGGSLVAMISCLGLTADEAAFVANGVVSHCRARRSCAGSLDGAVRAAVALAVDTVAGPDATQDQKDALVRDRCAGVATAVITRLVPAATEAAAPASAGPSSSTPSHPPSFAGTVAWHVSDFRGAADLAAAGAASSYIPWYSGGAAYTTFRETLAMDGGFEQMLPPCSGSPAGSPCVRVSAVPPGSALMPGLPAPPSDAEIAPGKFGPLPGGMTASAWAAYALVAPGEGVSTLMLQHGREQALAWAREAYPEVVARAAAAGVVAAGAGEQQQQQQQQEAPDAAPTGEAEGASSAASAPSAPEAAGARRKARKLLLLA
jgi:hypothetical protein